MKRLIALTLFAALLCGQQTGVVISHFTAPSGAIVAVTIGAEHCNFFAQLPTPGNVHRGCYNGTTLVDNDVIDVTAFDQDGSFTFGIVNGACPAGATCGSISWEFTPGAAPNKINYSITGTVLPDPGMEPTESGTF